MKVSKELLLSLDRLYNAPEMQFFRKWMKEAALEEMAKAIKTSEHTAVARGRAQMLMELQELIEAAPNALERLEKRNGEKKQGKSWTP